SLAIETLGAIGFLGGTAAARDDRQGALVLDLLTRFFAVIGLVRAHGQSRSRRVKHLFDDLASVDLPAGDGEAQRPAFAIEGGMDFRRSPPAADADCLIFLPLFRH